MKTINFSIMLIFLHIGIMNAQNHQPMQSTTAVANDKYSFAESFTEQSDTSSFTFKPSNQEKVTAILNTYFEGFKLSKKASTWNKMKNSSMDGNIFFIELKTGKLKLEWKNKSKTDHQNLIDELKKISKKIAAAVD